MSYNEDLKTQYEIMAYDETAEKNRAYVPDIEALIKEAPCEEMAKAWEQVADLIEKTKDNELFAFKGFTYRVVYTHKQKDGSYTIYQHGMPDNWTTEECEAELFRWIKEVEL